MYACMMHVCGTEVMSQLKSLMKRSQKVTTLVEKSGWDRSKEEINTYIRLPGGIGIDLRSSS